MTPKTQPYEPYNPSKPFNRARMSYVTHLELFIDSKSIGKPQNGHATTPFIMLKPQNGSKTRHYDPLKPIKQPT